MSTWEDSFSTWAQPPAKTEQERCENAEKAIRNAISDSTTLKYKNIKIFAQGSYRKCNGSELFGDISL